MSFIDLAKKCLSRHRGTSNTPIEKLVIVISDTSNEWNLAAVALAEQRETIGRSQNRTISFPKLEGKPRQTATQVYSTLDWNALAIANLARLKKENERTP